MGIALNDIHTVYHNHNPHLRNVGLFVQLKILLYSINPPINTSLICACDQCKLFKMAKLMIIFGERSEVRSTHDDEGSVADDVNSQYPVRGIS